VFTRIDPPLHLGQARRVDQMLRLRRQRHVKADEVGDG
jgi:hypothetical protein